MVSISGLSPSKHSMDALKAISMIVSHSNRKLKHTFSRIPQEGASTKESGIIAKIQNIAFYVVNLNKISKGYAVNRQPSSRCVVQRVWITVRYSLNHPRIFQSHKRCY